MLSKEISVFARENHSFFRVPYSRNHYSIWLRFSRDPNITDGALLVDLDAEERIAKRKVSAFVLDKITRKICRCTKDTVMKALNTVDVDEPRNFADASQVLLPELTQCRGRHEGW